jgi:DNA-binding transcriptional ArsR family regulator
MRRRETGPLANADLIAHPIRLRIIQTVAGRRMTTQQIAEVLPDVPQATLYRHVNRLAGGGVLEVVEEIPVRGTLEKVYALAEGAGRLPEEELAKATPEDHLRYFSVFFASLLSWLRSFLQQDTVDHRKDGLTCQGTTVYLSDEEYRQLHEEVSQLVRARSAHPPTPERRRRVLAWIAIPERRNLPTSDHHGQMEIRRDLEEE